ncbi:MAG: hypothetical protein JO097_15725 [Acidobacteriaceae bacterium]|nr:hypothetical protein [Acidobacteriaceae bacterium]
MYHSPTIRATAVCALVLILCCAPGPAFPAGRLLPGELAPGFQDTPSPQPGALAPNASAALRIVILEGDNAANVVHAQAVKPVIEVRDQNNAPVAGAMVTFSTPSDGPGAIFPTGSRQTTVMTDDTGRATLLSAIAVNPGPFQYQIAATFRGLQASAVISQNNYPTAAAAHNAAPGATNAQKHSSRMTWLIVGAVAVAAGATAAALHGGSGGSPSTTPTVTIGAGSGATVGAPH